MHNDETIEMKDVKKDKVCKKCSLEIPISAKLCTHCGSSQNWLYNFVKTTAIVAGVITAIVTATMHSISIFPIVKSYLNPNPSIEVLGFKSNKRIIIVNNGDHELYLSHLHYGATSLDYTEQVKELLSIVQNRPKDKVNLDEEIKDLFDTNQDIGLSIRPGQVINYTIETTVPNNLSYVHGKSEKDWDRIVLIAGLNKKSKIIRPIFLLKNDRRYKQMQRTFKGGLNTFPGEGTIYAYSPKLKATITFPFNIIGTIAVRNEERVTERIDRWINPRRGHPEDLE